MQVQIMHRFEGRSLANSWAVVSSHHAQGLSLAGRRRWRTNRKEPMAASPFQLDFMLALPTGLPSISALRRIQGLVTETVRFGALSQPTGNVWSRKSQQCSGEEAMHPEGLQESLWRDLFSDPAQWWDNRRSKQTPQHPDFRHKKSKVGLWLNNWHKPAWVDSQLGTWDTGMKGPPESVSTSVEEQGTFGKLGAHESRMCRKLCEDGRVTDAVDALNLLVQRGCHVHNNLFYRVLKRCIAHKDLVLGRRIHVLTIKSGYEGDAFLATHLIGLYASHGLLEEAMRVFTKVYIPSAYNWATIIFAYARHGDAAQAIRLYRQMLQATTVEPTDRIHVAVLKACAVAGDLVAGKEVHSHIAAGPGKPNMFVQTGLVDMYAKCGSLEDARRVFDGLSRRDVVTWNALFAGYALQGMGQEALSLYSSMQQEGLTPPDRVTFVCLLQACAIVAALPLGKQLHAQIEEQGLQADPGVGAALVNMYAKCGSMFDSQQVFDALPERTIETWKALICGYTRQGYSDVVFDLVHRMRLEGKLPDGITFLSVLTVCSHVGLVDEGRKYFEAMSTDYGISPTVEHYTCMMDLLGRAGHLDEALQMAKTMPFPPDCILWHTLLGACRKWNNVAIGKQAFEYALSVDGKDAASYVLMSKIYASAEMWEEAKEMQTRRLKCGAWKKPGQSWWTDMGGVVRTFVVGDKNHLESESTYAGLEQPA